jgi:fatty-acyl-CoA synthase
MSDEASPVARGPAQWSSDGEELARDTTIGGILRAAGARTPECCALVEGRPDARTRRRWTYGQLLDDALTAASALAEQFVPGERVAAWAPSIPESLVLTYGAALAGLVLVPVNPALRAGEVAHVLGQSEAAGVFVVPRWRDNDLMATLDEIRGGLPALRAVVDFGAWEAFCRGAGGGRRALPDVAPDDVAQLIYTSGTTGTPKGARLTHRGMTNAARVAAKRFDVRAGDVYVHTMPLFHVGGQVVAFQLCQSSATAVLVTSFDPGLVLALVEEEHATLTCGVPTMLLALTEHPDFLTRDLSTLRAVSGGGAVVPTELVHRIERQLGVQFAVVFGQTETCGFISQTHLDDAAQDKGATLGRPLPGVEVRVVDPDTSAVVTCGEVGELEVRGANVMAGYHDLPEDSAAAIRLDGWLRTGDLVAMDERGFLTMVGRLKEMIVSGGENIFPAEIEAALCEHPAVAQAAVVGVPDRRWGEAAVAVVRARPGHAPSAAALERYLRDRLAGYKVPRRWELVEELPLTATGKVQKFVLQDRLATSQEPSS